MTHARDYLLGGVFGVAAGVAVWVSDFSPQVIGAAVLGLLGLFAAVQVRARKATKS